MRQDSLTNRQIAFIIFGALVGYGVLSLPKTVVESAGTTGWISLLISTFIAVIYGYIIARLGYSHQGMTLFEYSQKLAGKFWGKIIIFIYIIYFFAIYTLEVRIAAEEIKAGALFYTPVWALSLVFSITIIYTVTKRLRVIGRINELYGVAVIFLFLTIHLFMFGQGELINMRPFFGSGEISTYLKGIPSTVLPFLGMEALLIVPFSAKNGKRVFWYVALTIVFIGLFYIMVVESCLSVMGTNTIVQYKAALLACVRRIEIRFLEILRRLDGLFLIGWLIAVYTTTSIFAYSAIFLVSNFFKNTSFNLVVVIMATASYILSLVPTTVMEVEMLFEYVSYLGFVTTGIIPPILLIITRVKKHGNKAKKT